MLDNISFGNRNFGSLLNLGSGSSGMKLTSFTRQQTSRPRQFTPEPRIDKQAYQRDLIAASREDLKALRTTMETVKVALDNALEASLDNTTVSGWTSDLDGVVTGIQGLADYAGSDKLGGVENVLDEVSTSLDTIKDPTSSESSLSDAAMLTQLQATEIEVNEALAVIDPLRAGGASSTTDLTVGSEALINTTTSGNQSAVSTTTLNNGNFVNTWTDTNSGDVMVQVFDSSGNKVGSEQNLSWSGGASTDTESTVTALATGGFVVGWTVDAGASGIGVISQRFDASGNTVGSQLILNTTKPGEQIDLSITALSDGGYVAIWEDNSSGNFDIRGQRVGSSGSFSGSEFLVNTTTSGTQVDASITTLSDGGWAVVWSSDTGSGSDVYMQRYTGAGAKSGGQVLINDTTSGDQSKAQILGLDDGGYVVTYQSENSDGSGTAIVAKQYASNGSAVTGETVVNTTTSDNQRAPSIAKMADGKYAIAWESNNQDGSGYGIYAQVFDTDGTALGDETLINTTTSGAQQAPSVHASSDGFRVSWVSSGQDGSGTGIYSANVAVTQTTTDETNLYDEVYKELNLTSQLLDGLTVVDDVQGAAQEAYYRIHNASGLLEKVASTDANYATIAPELADLDAQEAALEPNVIKARINQSDKHEVLEALVDELSEALDILSPEKSDQIYRIEASRSKLVLENSRALADPPSLGATLLSQGLLGRHIDVTAEGPMLNAQATKALFLNGIG